MENKTNEFASLKHKFNQLINKQAELNQDILSFQIELNNFEQTINEDEKIEIDNLINNQILDGYSEEKIEENENTILENSNDSINSSTVNSEINYQNTPNYTNQINHFKDFRYNNQYQPPFNPYQKPHTNTDKKIKEFEIKASVEKFIGENLINKVGILFTIIGVGIGAKYAIDNQLISPLTRIILGYLVGIGLLLFAIKLKEKYNNFSSVLFSGAMSIMYFITFFAYTLYNLIPQLFTFILMVIFTVFTVLAAIHYKKQIIALLGLVGAYAVPYLLSDGSGRVAILFSYVTLLNVGILYLSIKMKWDKLLYSAFGLTWLIFSSWFTIRYESNLIDHVYIASGFLIVFFTQFYLTLIVKIGEIEVYDNITKEHKYKKLLPIMLNNLLFFSIGYSILDGNIIGKYYTGLFTVVNALIHFGVTYYFYKNKSEDKQLINTFLGLVLIFITLAIPIQFDGKWVTLFITLEALILFYFGRVNLIKIFEYFSYPLILIGFFSLINDWQESYKIYIYNENYESIKNTLMPFVNVQFLSSLIVVCVFGVMTFIHTKYTYNLEKIVEGSQYTTYEFNKNFLLVLPILSILTLFWGIFAEITYYWKILYENTTIIINNGDNEIYKYNQNLYYFKDVTLMLYSILFFNALSIVNIKKIKNLNLANVSSIIILALNLIFLFIALTSLNQLNTNYIYNTNGEFFTNGLINVILRYISYLFIILSIYTINNNFKFEYINNIYKKPIELFYYFIALFILSNELLLWYDFFSLKDSTKLALSIFWGIYSLTLIVLGIWKHKKHLRLSAIVLFSVTILKLFFYDLSHLNTISKTVLFITLGVILLLISFLYNKYKHLINDNDNSEETKNNKNDLKTEEKTMTQDK